jgi:catechol 2,3-dioxygenase-like lactoylglutathione lyase family enzyme
MNIRRNDSGGTVEGRTYAGSGMTRRSVLAVLGVALASGFLADVCVGEETAPAPLDLPLKIRTICGHVGVSVPDVTRSAHFYSKLFGGDNVRGEKVPSLRYMINLGNAAAFNPSGPQSGRPHVAIGKLGTLGAIGETKSLVDHFCLNAEPYNEAAWRARLKLEGLTYYSNGVFGDINKIFVQVAGAQGGESLSAGTIEPLPSLYAGEPLVLNDGFEHVMLHVSSLDESVSFYKKMFGLRESERRAGVVYFSDGETKLALKQVAQGEKPNIPHFAAKVRGLNSSRVKNGLVALGARLETCEESKHAIRFADPDGLVVELWPA